MKHRSVLLKPATSPGPALYLGSSMSCNLLLLCPPEASAKLLHSTIVQIFSSKSLDDASPGKQGCSCGMGLVFAGAGAWFPWQVFLALHTDLQCSVSGD